MKAAGGALTAKQAPHRPGTAPALGPRAGEGGRSHWTADRLSQGATLMTFLLGTWLQAMRRKAARGARAGGGAKRTRPPRIALRLEALEDRTVPSTLTATSAADSGPGSLRAEIAAAQSGDTINFAPSLQGQT